MSVQASPAAARQRACMHSLLYRCTAAVGTAHAGSCSNHAAVVLLTLVVATIAQQLYCACWQLYCTCWQLYCPKPKGP